MDDHGGVVSLESLSFNHGCRMAGRQIDEGHMNDRQKAILAEIPRLRRYARSLSRDPDRADDLVQDCLERAFSRIANCAPGPA